MPEDLAPLEQLGDMDLVAATREGSNSAFAELWRRHSRAATGFAGTFRNIADPDDLVSEAYIRVFTAIKAGGGPSGVFRAYLLTAVRNTAMNWGRTSQKEVSHEDFDVFLGSDSAEELALQALERSTTSRAFKSLPQRFQEALWYSEVEHMPRAEIATILGIKPNAVSQLTFRARDALRTAWLQEHIKRDDLEPECAAVAGLIAGYVRDTLTRRQRKQVDDHAQECAGCLIVIEEGNHLAERLAFVILPLAVGVTGAAAYQALVPSGAASAAVLATPLASGKAASAASSAPHWAITAMVGVGTLAVVAIAGAVVAMVNTGTEASPPSNTGTVHSPAPFVSAAPAETTGSSASPVAPPTKNASAGPQPYYSPAHRATSTQTPAPTSTPSHTPAPSQSPMPTGTPSQSPTSTPTTPPVPAAPTVTWETDPNGWLLPSASGAAEPGSTVAIEVDGAEVATVGVDPNGSWSITNIPIAIGVHHLSALEISASDLRSPPTTPIDITLQQPAATAKRHYGNLTSVWIDTPPGMHVILADTSCSVINVSHDTPAQTYLHCMALPPKNATINFLLAPDTGSNRLSPAMQIAVPDEGPDMPAPTSSPTPTASPTPTTDPASGGMP